MYMYLCVLPLKVLIISCGFVYIPEQCTLTLDSRLC